MTRDGPYRVTGGIELIDADGTPVPLKAAASDIMERLGNGTMPCDGAWPKERK